MTKIFKSAALAATALASFSALPALAADAGQVLVVDFNQVFQSSTAAQSGTTQLRAKYDAVLQQRRTAFQSAAQTYNTQVDTVRKTLKPGTTVPEATQTQIQQAGQRAQQAQEQLQDTQEEVNQAAAYVRSQIIEKAGPIAEQIRGERKASVVISKDAALAADPSDDVTSTLIQRLNASFTTPSITPPQQTAPASPQTAPTKPNQGR